jgi:regulatory protein
MDARAARLAAVDLLSHRAWTRRDLILRLRRRGAPADVAVAAVDDLVSRGYVDDAAFARHWVETRSGRGYGASRLRSELIARGVAASVIDAALTGLETEAAFVTARALAVRRLPVLRRGKAERVAPRLHDYLRRRGYGPAVVARVVRSLIGTGADDQG